MHEISLLIGELAIRGTKLTLNAGLGTENKLLIKQSYILNHNDLFVCLFVCSELIEELVRATDLKFGMEMGNTVSRKTSSNI